MATITSITGMLLGPHEDSRDTLITLANGTYPVGTLLAVDTSTNKYVVFVVGGVTNGNGIAGAVLMEEVVKTGGTGDVTNKLRLISGRVRKSALKVAADGNPSNLTAVHIKQLHDQGIIVVDTTELSVANNY